MRRNGSTRPTLVLVSGLLCLAAGCQSGGVSEGERAERVIMVSYDGLGADLAWRLVVDGVAAEPGGLADLAREGFSVRRLRMADPTLTSVNHAVLATGRTPAETGVIGNAFRPAGGALGSRVNGFDLVPATPTLWSAARRQGLRVGALVWPAAGLGGRADTADFGIAWPVRSAAPAEVLELGPETAGTTGELPSADGVPALAWPLVFDLGEGAEPATAEALIALVDGNPDGTPRWDTVGVRAPGGADWTLHGEREWFPVEVELRLPDVLGRNRWASWSKIVHLDRRRGALRLYRGALWRTVAWPEDFEERLTGAIGPWPGEPDGRRLEEWWLDAATGVDLDVYLEQIERLDRWLDDAARWVAENEDFDLLLAYHPGPDEFQHTSLIVDPDQWAWSPGRELAAAEGLKRVGRSVDVSIAALWSLLDPERDALVVVSDHGQLPVTDEVALNLVLAEAGLVTVEEGGDHPGVAPSSPMVAVAEGGFAHLYLNLAGRDEGGVVPRASAGELLARAARALADLEVDDRPVVETVARRDELAGLGLDHPASGDLVVFLAPGLAASNRLTGAPIAPSRVYGQHGFATRHDGMCGMLFVRGAGIRKGRADELPAAAVAPLVARLLGVSLEE
ncbi:MAG: alkaline phosphatase family protein [Thermoanaerobaculales bacterium]|jgi:predicted AlkP superfamily phosphohydrolase/phosphomutase|nr:alkaline phosphatase family protein [Thermoanaerobaculales bacterium]